VRYVRFRSGVLGYRNADGSVVTVFRAGQHWFWSCVSSDGKTARYSRAFDCEAAARRDAVLSANMRELAGGTLELTH
jgi:hypothetical protein